MEKNLYSLAVEVGKALQSKGFYLATAESCTGGEVAQVVTSVAGSSNWFDRGFVTYSNQAKMEMLGVKAETINHHGAVSEYTAQEMAQGALQHSRADVSLAVTGIAGPDGGTPEKPVGLVWFAWAGKHFPHQSQLQVFKGDRISIRDQATFFVLDQLIKFIP